MNTKSKKRDSRMELKRLNKDNIASKKCYKGCPTSKHMDLIPSLAKSSQEYGFDIQLIMNKKKSRNMLAACRQLVKNLATNFQMAIPFSKMIQFKHMRCFFDIYIFYKYQKTSHIPNLDHF